MRRWIRRNTRNRSFVSLLSTGRDDAYDIWPLASGYVLTGSTENPATERFDRDGLRRVCGSDRSGYTRGHGARGLNDVWLVTLDDTGKTIEMQVTGGDAEDHNIIARLSPDGRAWLGGYCKRSGSSDWDVSRLELDPRGHPIRSLRYGGTGDDGAVSLWPRDERGLVVTGYTTGPNGDRDILLLEVRP